MTDVVVVKYDIGKFARSFTWGLIHWNSAEYMAKLMLTHLLGDTKTALAIVADMGNRSLLEGLRAGVRELSDEDKRAHILHFSSGFGTILGYRNLYVHSLMKTRGDGRHEDTIELVGLLGQVKGKGRLRSMSRPVSQDEIAVFREHCRALSYYSMAIMRLLSPETAAALTLPPTSLEKPNWPASLQEIPNFHQD